MKLATKKTGRALLPRAGVLAISAVAGCFALGSGKEPPLDKFYYPTALVTSPGQHALYVVNSDFDIQFTGGVVQTLDLDKLRQCVLHLDRDLAAAEIPAELSCCGLGLGTNPSPALVPGPCGPIDITSPYACRLLENPNPLCCDAAASDDPKCSQSGELVLGPFIRSARIIGAFASAAKLVKDPGSDAQRLFVSVRGDPSVTYFDTTHDVAGSTADPFRLDCGGEIPGDQIKGQSIGGSCAQSWRVGISPYQSKRQISMPIEPTGVAASDDGHVVVAVHQTGSNSSTHGQASLIVNPWGNEPTLQFTVTGLPDSPAAVASVPTAGYVAALRDSGNVIDYRPGFLVAFEAAREVDLLRYYDDSAGTSRDFLQRVAAFSIGTNSDGSDSRGIAVNDADRKACEQGCSSADLPCLRACVDVPIEVYVTNRTPASLLVGKLETQLEEQNGKVTSVADVVHMNDMIPLSSGPSRVAVGNVLDHQGRPSPRVFAISFDSRYVVIYDPAQRRVEAAVRTGRGPHALAFDVTEKSASDAGHALLYVGHFTDSYIGVVDLDTRNTRTYGSMFASIGKQLPPKESN